MYILIVEMMKIAWPHLHKSLFIALISVSYPLTITHIRSFRIV